MEIFIKNQEYSRKIYTLKKIQKSERVKEKKKTQREKIKERNQLNC